MKANALSSSKTAVAEKRSDSVKLVSLLALAGGAAAMPQVSNADIIVTDLGNAPAHVGFSGGDSASFLFTTPGAANQHAGFVTHEHSQYTSAYSVFTRVYRTVTLGRQGGALQIGAQAAVANGRVSPQAAGAPWNNNASVTLLYNATVGVATTYGHVPANGYNHLYLAWVFQDTTQLGDPLLYGWVEVGLTIGNNLGPSVTIYRYAYDNTGAPITMGAVPEPAPMAFLALGALTLGAKGVRNWRRNRPATHKA